MPQVAAGALILGGASVAAGGVGLALGAAGLLGSVAQFGFGLILSGASQALMPRPKGPELRDRTVSIRQPVAPREMVYGRVRKGGTIVFVHVTGSRKDFLHLVIPLASHRVQSIGSMYFGETLVSFPDGTIRDRFAETVRLRRRLGTLDQTRIPELESDAPDKWGDAHRLTGCAYAYVRLKYNASQFPAGIPAITFDVEGKNDILDPRTGTVGFTDNAALCVADYMAHPRFGLGAAIGAEDGIDTAELIAAANVCDEDVDVPGGATEKRYTCNGVVSLAEQPKTIIEGMLTSMGGRAAWRQGRWYILPAAYRTPTVALGPDDLAPGGLTLETRVSAASNFNGVRGQFVSPENDWQPDDFPAVQSAAYLAEDGGVEAWNDLVLPFTTSSSMAQRLARIELERRRRQMTVTLSCKLTALRATAGETVEFSYARYGFADKPFEVEGMRLAVQDGQLLPVVTLRETSPLVFDWDASEAEIYAAAPRTTLPDPFDVPPPGPPSIAEELYETRSGVRTRLRVTWPAAPSEFVTEYRVQARRRLDAEGAATGDAFITVGRTDQTTFIVPDIEQGTWDVQVAALTALGIQSDDALASREVLGLAAPPSAIEELTLQAAGGLALLQWRPVPDLDVLIGGRVMIRHTRALTPVWANSVSMREVAGSAGEASVALKPGTYLVRARDSEGVLGPMAMVSTKGFQAVAFAAVDELVEESTFAGAKTNCEVDIGALTLTDPELPGEYLFDAGLDMTTVRSVRLRSEIEVAAENLEALFDSDELFDSLEDFDGTDEGQIDVIVEVRTTDDDPSGSPVWSGWTRVDGTEDRFRAAEFRARLISATPSYNLRVTRLRVLIDEVSA